MIRRIFMICLVFVFTAVGLASLAVAEEEGRQNSSRIKRLVSQLYERRNIMDAQRRLENYGVEVIKHVLPVIYDKSNESARVAALRIIGKVGDPSVEDEVVKVLKDKSKRVRQEAVRTLSVIARKKSSIEPLKKLLNDLSPVIRYNTVKTLGKLVGVDADGIFIRALSDFDERVRKYAVEALGKLRSERSVPYLAQLVTDFFPEVRIELVKALGSIGTKECLRPLIMLMGDPDVNTRITAIDQIAGLDVDGVEEALITAAESSDYELASRAITALERINSSRALEVALANVDDEHMVVKVAAIEVIGKLGDSTNKPILESLLEAESSLVRKKARNAMLAVGSRT